MEPINKSYVMPDKRINIARPLFGDCLQMATLSNQHSWAHWQTKGLPKERKEISKKNFANK